jgi:tetratricopeptide (TPR) repeat protein
LNCRLGSPHAVKCLRAAIAILEPSDARVLQLRFKICDVWAGAKNWALASGEAGQIARDYSGSPQAGQALVRRIRYLAAQGDNQSLLNEIDDISRDPRCAGDLAELQYHKWKSLRQTGQGQAASIVLKKYLEQYPEEPNAAEMYYAVAIDCLSAQRYDDALAILESLQVRYPKSSFSGKAEEISKKLHAMRSGPNAATPEDPK